MRTAGWPRLGQGWAWLFAVSPVTSVCVCVCGTRPVSWARCLTLPVTLPVLCSSPCWHRPRRCPGKRVTSLSLPCAQHPRTPSPSPAGKSAGFNSHSGVFRFWFPPCGLPWPQRHPGREVRASERADFGRSSRGLWPGTARESQVPGDPRSLQLRFSRGSSNVHALRTAAQPPSTRGRAPATLGGAGPPAAPGPGTSAGA